MATRPAFPGSNLANSQPVMPARSHSRKCSPAPPLTASCALLGQSPRTGRSTVGMLITTRWRPSADATTARPVAAACAMILPASAEYSASENTSAVSAAESLGRWSMVSLRSSKTITSGSSEQCVQVIDGAPIARIAGWRERRVRWLSSVSTSIHQPVPLRLALTPDSVARQAPAARRSRGDPRGRRAARPVAARQARSCRRGSARSRRTAPRRFALAVRDRP